MMKTIKLLTATMVLSLLGTGCSTTKDDFIEHGRIHWKKNPNNYCSYSIQQTYTGHYPRNMDGRYACSETQAKSEEKSQQECMEMSFSYRSGCMVAFTYVLKENKIYSWEEHHVARITRDRGAINEAARIEEIDREKMQNEKLMRTCDGYGFKRQTAEHSNCVLQVVTTNRIQAQKAEEIAAQQKILEDIQKGQALDSLIRLDNAVNRRTPTITCNPSGLGGMTCK